MKKLLSLFVILLIGFLAAATFVEKSKGPAYAQMHFYHAPWMILLWAAVAVVAVIVAVRNKAWKRPVVLLLHSSLLIILIGAMTTHVFSQSGVLEMKPGVTYSCFKSDKDPADKIALPFSIKLSQFTVETYPGGMMPMDFVSEVTVTDKDGTSYDEVISMNNILKHKGYRFYQSDYDGEGGSTLQVSLDPWGIAITYTGYVLLLIALVAMFFEKNGQFRMLLSSGSKTVTVILLLLFATSAFAAPRTLPKKSAHEMGNVLVSYKGRVCPMRTLANDFTNTVCGSTHYDGLNAEQVLSGFIFNIDQWRREPVFKIKGDNVRRYMNLDGRYATLQQLEEFVYNVENDTATYLMKDKNFRAALEKYRLVEKIYTRQLLKMYPHADSASKAEGKCAITWYSQNDALPEDIIGDEYIFIRKQLSFCNELVVRGDYDEFNNVMRKIRKYQMINTECALPSSARLNAEQLYNRLSFGKVMTVLSVILGIALFVICILNVKTGKKMNRVMRVIGIVWLALLGLFLVSIFILRWIAGGHIPLAGSYDSMVFLALCACVISLIMTRKYDLAIPFGMLVAGLSLMLPMMKAPVPPVTNLMPVLSSPLLTLHVTVIMIAYALLFLVLLNGVVGVFSKVGGEKLQHLSLIMLYPAVALLTIGIFIGAVWANISWGNYWSWDPKEVWALITMFVYAAPLHGGFLPCFRNTRFFHFYCIIAFLSILITYFGVNFILGGIHAYN